MTTPETVPPPKKHGCFFYGCIISLILLFVLALGIFLAVRFTLGKMNGAIARYTDTIPVAIPKTPMSADELKQLNTRVAAFNASVNAHSNTPPLVLNGPEINALIAENPNLKEYQGTFAIDLEGDQIKGQISLPLDNIHNRAFQVLNVKGRYLNGSGTFKAAITNGELYLSVQTLEVKGKPLPPEFMSPLQQQNLADGFNKNPNASSDIRKYESVEVKDGTLIVKPKSP